MIYLATEMLLYLLCAALLGLALGWLIWGLGSRQRIAKVSAEMAKRVEIEKDEAQQARVELKRSDEKLQQAIDAEKAEAARSIAEARQLFEAERRAASEAKAELNRVRLEMEEAINAERASAGAAIDQAEQLARDYKAAADEAQAAEQHLRAELEELRLMSGAEKLAAQTARSELARLRAEMEEAVEAERQAGAQAKLALADVRSALARTFGDDAGITAALSGPSDADEPMDATPDPDEAMEGKAAEPPTAPLPTFAGSPPPADPDDGPWSVTDTDAAAETAAAGEDEAAGEQDEAAEAAATARSTSVWDPLDDTDIEDREDEDEAGLAARNDQAAAGAAGSPHRPETIELLPASPAVDARPASLHDERPNEVDDLLQINGVGPATAKLLNEIGCFQFRQLAGFSSADIAWLARAIDTFPDRIERDDWVEQAKALHLKKYGRHHDEPDWARSEGSLANGG